MSVLVGSETRLLVQGITGREGEFHTRAMLQYGTNAVAGVTPGRGGQNRANAPVFNPVTEPVPLTGSNASITFVPAAFAGDALPEAVGSGIPRPATITDS